MHTSAPPDGWTHLREQLETRSGAPARRGWVPARSRRAAEPGAHARQGGRRLDRAHVVVATLVTAVALVGTVVVLGNAQPVREEVAPRAGGGSSPVAALPQEWAPAPDVEETTGSASAAPLVVHVVGDVARPGVVQLAPSSRVGDAIDAAGGATGDADLSTVNLARLVVDGEQVRVGLPPLPNLPGQAPAEGGQASGVALNTATAAQLTELPGIGPVLAERIVAYRSEVGPFRSIDQLLDVSGIGPAVLDDIHGRLQL